MDYDDLSVQPPQTFALDINKKQPISRRLYHPSSLSQYSRYLQQKATALAHLTQRLFLRHYLCSHSLRSHSARL